MKHTNRSLLLGIAPFAALGCGDFDGATPASGEREPAEYEVVAYEHHPADAGAALAPKANLTMSNVFGNCRCADPDQRCLYNDRGGSTSRCFVPDKLPVRIKYQNASDFPAFAVQVVRDGLDDAINKYHVNMGNLPFVWVDSGEDILFKVVNGSNFYISDNLPGNTTECHNPQPHGQRCSVDRTVIELGIDSFYYGLPASPFAADRGCWQDTDALTGARHIAEDIWIHEMAHALGLSHRIGKSGDNFRVNYPRNNSWRCVSNTLPPSCGTSSRCGQRYAVRLFTGFHPDDIAATKDFFQNNDHLLPE